MDKLQVKLEPEEEDKEIKLCSIIKIEQEEIISQQVTLCSIIKIEDEKINEGNLRREIDRIAPCDVKSEVKTKLKFSNSGLKRKVTKKNFKCDKCEKAYETRKKLSAHLLQHGDFHCKFCDRLFHFKAYFENHKCGFCQICNLTFPTMARYRSHFTHIHSANRVKFECDFCGKILSGKRYLLFHFKAVHSIFEHRTKYKCATCEKDFADLSLLRIHMKNHEIVECEFCKLKLSKINLKEHLENKHIKKEGIKCKNCPAIFQTRKYLQTHVRIVHEKKFQCKICEKKFGRQHQLDDHLKIHENPEAFRCQSCKKIFATSQSLKAHMNFVHNDKNQEKKFKCEKCEFSTNRKNNFKDHQKVHENYKTKLKSRTDWIKCKKCSALLASKDSYAQHQKETHGNSSFECDICGIKIKRKGDTKMHMERKHLKKN